MGAGGQNPIRRKSAGSPRPWSAWSRFRRPAGNIVPPPVRKVLLPPRIGRVRGRRRHGTLPPSGKSAAREAVPRTTDGRRNGFPAGPCLDVQTQRGGVPRDVRVVSGSHRAARERDMGPVPPVRVPLRSVNSTGRSVRRSGAEILCACRRPQTSSPVFGLNPYRMILFGPWIRLSATGIPPRENCGIKVMDAAARIWEHCTDDAHGGDDDAGQSHSD